MFIRNVSWLSTDYTALYAKRYNSLQSVQFISSITDAPNFHLIWSITLAYVRYRKALTLAQFASFKTESLHVLFTEPGDMAAWPRTAACATGLPIAATNTPHSFNSLKWIGNNLRSIITVSQHVEMFFLWSREMRGETAITPSHCKRMGNNNTCSNNLNPPSLAKK
jgi:hypothetical protein